MAAENVIDPFPSVRSTQSIIVKRTLRLPISPEQQLNKILSSPESIITRGDTRVSTYPQGVYRVHPSLSYTQIQQLIELFRIWLKTYRSSAILTLVSKLEDIIATMMPYTFLNLDPTLILSIKDSIGQLTTSYRIKSLHFGMIKLWAVATAQTDITYDIARYSAVFLNGAVTKLTASTFGKMCWDDALANFSTDFGNVGNTPDGTLASDFFIQFAGGRPSLSYICNSVQQAALAEAYLQFPTFAKATAYPSTYSLTNCPNINRILKDWCFLYQSEVAIEDRKSFMANLWAEAMTETIWGDSDHEFGFLKKANFSAETKWIITWFCIQNYGGIGERLLDFLKG